MTAKMFESDLIELMICVVCSCVVGGAVGVFLLLVSDPHAIIPAVTNAPSATASLHFLSVLLPCMTAPKKNGSPEFEERSRGQDTCTTGTGDRNFYTPILPSSVQPRRYR